MNILELCLSPDLGGLELYVVNTCDALSKTDNVIAVVNEKGKIKERLRNKKIIISYLQYKSKSFPVFAAIKLAKIIDENKVDVIHMHWGRDLALAAMAKKISSRKPLLAYTRQMQITRSKDDLYHRFIYKEVDLFISITEKLANLAREFLSVNDKGKVRTLYYGVKRPNKILSADEKNALRNKSGFSGEDFVVGLFGRIEEQKGQHQLVEAIAQLKQQGKEVKGLIVGHAMDDNYLEKLKNMVARLDVEKNIHFMDFVENPQDWMQTCDMVLLATKEETFGLVLAEAMQAGIPVIGTDSGGVPEIIEHGVTGFLFDYGDVASLASYISELKQDENKRKAFAQAGQQKARQLFDMDNHFRELRKLLAGEG